MSQVAALYSNKLLEYDSKLCIYCGIVGCTISCSPSSNNTSRELVLYALQYSAPHLMVQILVGVVVDNFTGLAPRVSRLASRPMRSKCRR